MTIEDRVTRALAEEAESIDVDVEALRTRTRDRLAGGRALDRPSPRRRRGPLLLAAAASVAVVAAGATLLTTGTDSDRATNPAPGEVDVQFSCPAQRDVDVTSGAQDEFLPALGPGGPAAVAEEYGAPRWAFVEDGDRATLRLGNADGTLGSVTTYRAVDGGWALVSARACGGAGGTPAVPTRDELRLGTHGTEPYEPWFSSGEVDGEPVVLDDRAVYDYSGLVTRHRTIQVAPCGDKLCWQAGRPTGYVGTKFKAGTTAQDASGVFFEPDDLVGRENPFGVWAVWDPDGSVSALRAIGDDGQVRESQTFTDPSWQGAMLSVLVAPRAGTRWVEVETTDHEVLRQPG